METGGAGPRGLPPYIGPQGAHICLALGLVRCSPLELHLITRLLPGLSCATEGSSGPGSGPRAGQPSAVPAVMWWWECPKTEVNQVSLAVRTVLKEGDAPSKETNIQALLCPQVALWAAAHLSLTVTWRVGV